MKRRYLYSLLFGIPGLFASVMISFVVFGSAAGFLWLFVSGDNPWPSSVGILLPLLFILTFLVLWLMSIVLGYATGKKIEGEQGVNKKHILISVGATILPILLIVLYQLSVGNLGPRSDSDRCSDYCTERGYSGSGMPPKNSGERTCSCFDLSGREVVKISIDTIAPGK